jgi:hypothetical protein
MTGRERESWRKEIGVAIAPKRDRSAIEEEENKIVCRIPDIPFYGRYPRHTSDPLLLQFCPL